MLAIKLIEGDIPVTEKPITVVEGDYDGITICDYINGKLVDNGIYVSSVDFDNDEILTYNYQDNTAYIENSARELFIIMRESAKLFIECGGNYERYAEVLAVKSIS